MMDELKTFGNESSDEVYSEAVRAGKRTYFFDVKSTKGNDYYVTITESRRKIERDGTFSYEKHKIFLYKEDFDKFDDAFKRTLDFVKENKSEFFENGRFIQPERPESPRETTSDTTISDTTISDIDKEFDAL